MKRMFVGQNRAPVRRIAAPPLAGVPPPSCVGWEGAYAGASGGFPPTREGDVMCCGNDVMVVGMLSDAGRYVPAYAGRGRDVLWE